MANFENRNRDSAKKDPSSEREKDKLAPGQQGPPGQGGAEPREGQQGQRPAQEYPGEGVGAHYPSSGEQTGGSQGQSRKSGDEPGKDNDGAE
ncbi:MAG: hypothetical protein WEF99_07100 [Thermoanaerobaculia bacterium]